MPEPKDPPLKPKRRLHPRFGIFSAKLNTITIFIAGTALRFKDVPEQMVDELLIRMGPYEIQDIGGPVPASTSPVGTRQRVGSIVRDGRKRRRHTQTEFAVLLQIPQSNLSDIELGKRAWAGRLAKLLGGDYRNFM